MQFHILEKEIDIELYTLIMSLLAKLLTRTSVYSEN